MAGPKREDTMNLRPFAATMLPTLALLSLAACTTNLATGKRTFTLLSRDEEVALGAEAAPQFTTEYGGKVPDDRLQQYVTGIGKKMAAETEGDNPSLPWEFTLLNTDVINAFALPGGKVFFTRGLAKELTNEAQMAGVLGHEIGHVTARHANQRISSQLLFNAGLAVSAVVVEASGNRRAQQIGGYGIPALAIGGNLVFLKFGRDEESEADSLGMRYMSNVGYDPHGQLEVMQTLARLSKGASQPELLSTHPLPETRIERLQDELRSRYAHTQGNPGYQTFADRYKREFIDVLAKVPPPPAPAKQGALNLRDPVTWCAVCAAKARMEPTAEPREGGGVGAMLAAAALSGR
jgi:predicted Zn-dependent protease